jgi:A/G-specific adenine glycosylase
VKRIKGERGFAATIAAWQRRHGRHDLPWQQARDPYRVWLSEIMLQQTQVATVIPYYRRFLARFRTVRSLAAAPLDAVLAEWSGLGYYSRARNLHRAATGIVARCDGRFPRDFAAIVDLPGIGRSTAGAICVFAFGDARPILDGNVKRIFARCFGIAGYPGKRDVEAELWRIAETLLPRRNVQAYTQGLMDLGATVCLRARPRCDVCPLARMCVALKSNRIGELPAARPRKQVPARRTDMLLLLHDGALMLEKRPPTGIWGGMWCLPQAEEGTDLAALCERQYGAKVVEIRDAPPAFTHGFTHFTLAIRPRRFRVTALLPHTESPGLTWLPVGKALAAGIPAPVRRILQSI